MSDLERRFLFLSSEVQQLLDQHETSIEELLRRADSHIKVDIGEDPAKASEGQKEPATILLASAAVIASLTPILREVIRGLSGRDPVISERRLVPTLDAKGEVVRDSKGEPVLYWTDVSSQAIKIKGFGVEISFGSK